MEAALGELETPLAVVPIGTNSKVSLAVVPIGSTTKGISGLHWIRVSTVTLTLDKQISRSERLMAKLTEKFCRSYD